MLSWTYGDGTAFMFFLKTKDRFHVTDFYAM